MNRLSFSVLLNLLMDNFPNENGDKYTLTELSRQTGISANQLGLYRRGTHTNPTLDNMVNLMDLFGMPLAYLDCTNKIDAMKMITAIHKENYGEEQNDARVVRFRSSESLTSSDEALNQLQEILQWIFEREEALKNGEDEPPLPDFSKP